MALTLPGTTKEENCPMKTDVQPALVQLSTAFQRVAFSLQVNASSVMRMVVGDSARACTAVSASLTSWTVAFDCSFSRRLPHIPSNMS